MHLIPLCSFVSFVVKTCAIYHKGQPFDSAALRSEQALVLRRTITGKKEKPPLLAEARQKRTLLRRLEEDHNEGEEHQRLDERKAENERQLNRWARSRIACQCLSG